MEHWDSLEHPGDAHDGVDETDFDGDVHRDAPEADDGFQVPIPNDGPFEEDHWYLGNSLFLQYHSFHDFFWHFHL